MKGPTSKKHRDARQKIAKARCIEKTEGLLISRSVAKDESPMQRLLRLLDMFANYGYSRGGIALSRNLIPAHVDGRRARLFKRGDQRVGSSFRSFLPLLC